MELAKPFEGPPSTMIGTIRNRWVGSIVGVGTRLTEYKGGLDAGFCDPLFLVGH